MARRKAVKNFNSIPLIALPRIGNRGRAIKKQLYQAHLFRAGKAVHIILNPPLNILYLQVMLNHNIDKLNKYIYNVPIGGVL